MTEPDSAAKRNETVLPVPYATAGHLYLLVAGVLLGVALGPAVLGRLAPQTYDAWFVGGGEAAAQVVREEAGLTKQVELLRGIGVTAVAEEELLARETERIAPLKAQAEISRAERDRAVGGWLLSIVAALALLAVAEPLVMPEPREGGRVEVPRAMGGLVTARYALLAVWVMIAVAKPGILLQLPWPLVGTFIAVAAAAALVPLGRRSRP